MDYNKVYQALKSPRSMDPFMGMQLGAVRLPPSFPLMEVLTLSTPSNQLLKAGVQ